MARWLTTGALFRIIFITAIILSVAGCKLRNIVPEGGQLISESSAYTCDAGQRCTIDITDIFFDETFRAVAAEGYYFRYWKAGNRFLCAYTYDACHLATSSFAGNSGLMKLLESEEVFFLSPIFAQGKCEFSTTETEDIFQNIVRTEGEKCTIQGRADPGYQGLVRTFRNGKLVSVIGWDQGRMQGMATRYYDDGKTLKESSSYINGKYDGVQQQYDRQGRLTVTARWKAGQLNGQYISYDYTDSVFWEGIPKVSTSNYENGKLQGVSTIEYPDGTWEKREWALGVQQGLYEVFVPAPGQRVNGWRYVYVFKDGLIWYGYAYLRTAIPGTDGYEEQGGPDSQWIWPCNYIDGILDEASCFKDGLDLGPRL